METEFVLIFSSASHVADCVSLSGRWWGGTVAVGKGSETVEDCQKSVLIICLQTETAFNQRRAKVKRLCGRAGLILIRNNSTIRLQWADSRLVWIMDDWCSRHKAMPLMVFVPKFPAALTRDKVSGWIYIPTVIIVTVEFNCTKTGQISSKLLNKQHRKVKKIEIKSEKIYSGQCKGLGLAG